MGENVMNLDNLEVLAPAGDYERLCVRTVIKCGAKSFI